MTHALHVGRKYDNINEEHIKQKIQELENIKNEEQNKIEVVNKEIEDVEIKIKEKETEKQEIENKKENIINSINKEKETIQNLKIKEENLQDNKSTYVDDKNQLQCNLEALRDKKEQILNFNVGDKEQQEKLLQQIVDNIKEYESKLFILAEQNQNSVEYITTCKHIIQLITKEFRTYLLQNSIVYLNKLLKQYSKKLFSNENDIIRIESNNTKLDIMLGNAIYESLSAGEKTRVNIALLLAQKSLANTIGNISSNIIILDEVLGCCDSKAEENCINLLLEELEELESIFIISHKELLIGYDKRMAVTKDENGLSTIKMD